MGRGIASNLAKQLSERFTDWKDLIDDEKLLKANFSPGDLAAISKARSRKEIPRQTVLRLIHECDFKCCLCWNIDSPSGVIIHHIRAHADVPDDRYENLVVLCVAHHDSVHVKHELSRHPHPPEFVTHRKLEFIAAIAEFKAGRRVAPGRESNNEFGATTSPPMPPPNFFGRRKVVEDVLQTLTAKGGRVAIIGMGGVGKTSIGLKVAEEARTAFQGGILWTDAGSDITSLSEMLRPWIRSLGGDPSGMDIREQASLFSELLKKRAEAHGPLLIIIDDVRVKLLDDLQHVTNRLPKLASLLVTTRDTAVAVSLGAKPFRTEPLEREYCLKLLESISDSDMLRADTKAVDSMLSQLGHLPLAVELVARQIAIRSAKPGFSIANFCSELEKSNLKVLSFPGHRGIAMSFALSYDYLEILEQQVFRSLGLFAPGAIQAEAVAATLAFSAFEAESALDRLVAVSMLNWSQQIGDYRIHPLLKKYSEHLYGNMAPPEKSSSRKGFFGYYASKITALTLKSPVVRQSIETMFPNVERAVEYAALDGHHSAVSDTVFALCVDLSFFSSGDFDERSIPVLERSIRAAEHSKDQNKVSAFNGHLGSAYARLGRIRKAILCYERAIDVARENGNNYDLASHLQNLGAVLISEAKDLPKAESVLHQALEAAKLSENIDATIGCFGTLGGLHRDIGNLDEAARLYKAALEASRIAGNRLSEGNSLSNLGLVVDQLGNAAEGERLIREAFEIAVEIGDRRGEGNRIGHLGGILLAKSQRMVSGSDRDRLLCMAQEHIESAMEIAQQTGDIEKSATWLMNLGNVCGAKGEVSLALRKYEAALEAAQEGGFSRLEAQVNYNLGSALASQGSFASALRCFQISHRLLLNMRSPMVSKVEFQIGRLKQILMR